jgi:hypothetical protein
MNPSEQEPWRPAATIVRSLPTQRRVRVFLCHSSADKPKVRELYARLVDDGFAPWLDEKDLRPGESWRDAIRAAVRAADFILVCLSDRSMTTKGYVHKEIKQALDVADEQPEGRIFVIPLRLEHCRVPQRLDHLHWVDLFAEDGYARLSSTLRDHPMPPDARSGSSPSPEPRDRARHRPAVPAPPTMGLLVQLVVAAVVLTSIAIGGTLVGMWTPPLPPLAGVLAACLVTLTQRRRLLRPAPAARVVAVVAAAGLSVAGVTWELESGPAGRHDRPGAGSSTSEDVRYDPRVGRGPYRVEGTCVIKHTCVLYERRAPSVSSEKVARLHDNKPLTIVCQARGGTVKAPAGGSSDIWDRLYDRRSGPYVSDYFTNTPGDGAFTKSIPRCPPEKRSAR